MHSGDCWARTEMVNVSPGVEERNSSSFQRNVIIDNLPIVLTFRHSIEEFSGQSRFHVFLLLLLLVFFFQNTWKISIWKKKERGWRKFRLTTACDYHFRLEFFYESATVILRPWVLVRPRELNTRPPALQSSALPIELQNTRLYFTGKRWWKRGWRYGCTGRILVRKRSPSGHLTRLFLFQGFLRFCRWKSDGSVSYLIK